MVMKFRNTPVDGFFIVHVARSGSVNDVIKNRLEKLHAVMEDVQYSTHVKNNILYNDILVMYRCQSTDTDTELLDKGIE